VLSGKVICTGCPVEVALQKLLSGAGPGLLRLCSDEHLPSERVSLARESSFLRSSSMPPSLNLGAMQLCPPFLAPPPFYPPFPALCDSRLAALEQPQHVARGRDSRDWGQHGGERGHQLQHGCRSGPQRHCAPPQRPGSLETTPTPPPPRLPPSLCSSISPLPPAPNFPSASVWVLPALIADYCRE